MYVSTSKIRKVPVTTTINPETLDNLQKRGWVVSELVQLGYETRLKMGQENRKINEILDRIDEIEENSREWKNIALRYKRECEILKGGENGVLE